jgi:cytochrome c-type biogenesis protein CcmH
MKRAIAPMALAIAFACMSIVPASAAPDDLANEIAAKIMSPFCPGVTLENCPSDKAVALRERIEGWAQQGWDEGEIMARLVDLYGDPIRALPPASGTGLWAWIAPALALLAGAGIATVLARRWTKRPATQPDREATVVPAETRARLNEELDALRGRP